jgi:hypothetical protein
VTVTEAIEFKMTAAEDYVMAPTIGIGPERGEITREQAREELLAKRTGSYWVLDQLLQLAEGKITMVDASW